MRRTLRQSALWLGLFIWVAAVVSAANADVTYDYQGNVLTPTAGDFPDGQSITGDIVVSSALPPSSLDATPAISSFSFTDGVDTISNTNGGNVDLSATGFTTNSLGQITSGSILVFGNNTASGTILAEMSIKPSGDGVLSDHQSTTGSVIVSEANNSTPGTWTSPPPSLYVTVKPGGTLSMDMPGKPTSQIADLTLSTTPVPGGRLLDNFPTDVSTLTQAAMVLGYAGFDWVSQITSDPNADYSALVDRI